MPTTRFIIVEIFREVRQELPIWVISQCYRTPTDVQLGSIWSQSTGITPQGSDLRIYNLMGMQVGTEIKELG